MAGSAYKPYRPAKRPGGRPGCTPKFRVLVHRSYLDHYNRMPEAVGLQQAKELWDHLAFTPNAHPVTSQSCVLRGKAGRPMGPGWSRTFHYEVSSKARVNYQYHDAYKTDSEGDPHPVVAILTISLSSH
jgi:hypothetical protein